MAEKYNGKPKISSNLGALRDKLKNFTDETSQEEKEIFVAKENTIMNLDTKKVKPNPNQPRKVFLEDGLKELGDSITLYGQRQPIEVYKDPNNEDEWIIHTGERRWTAIDRYTDFDTVKAVDIQNISEHKRNILSLIENIQREDLSTVEIAMFLERLWEEGDYTLNKELAQKIGKPASYVTKYRKINNIQDEILSEIIEKKIKVGVSILYEIAKIDTEEGRLKAWQKWKDKELKRDEIHEKPKKEPKPKVDKITKSINTLSSTFKIRESDKPDFESEMKTLLVKYGAII